MIHRSDDEHNKLAPTQAGIDTAQADFLTVCVGGPAGGITIAQQLSSAELPDMPESALASGCIDYILSPEAIAQEIVRIVGADPRPSPKGHLVSDMT